MTRVPGLLVEVCLLVLVLDSFSWKDHLWHLLDLYLLDWELDY